MTRPEEMEACPFCGGAAHIGSGPNYAFVNCVDCLASTNLLLATEHQPTEAEAIAAWNTRRPTVPEGLVEAAFRAGFDAGDPDCDRSKEAENDAWQEYRATLSPASCDSRLADELERALAGQGLSGQDRLLQLGALVSANQTTFLAALRSTPAREALQMMVGAAYPVAAEINPRGYNWSEAYLDQALPYATAAIAAARPFILEEAATLRPQFCIVPAPNGDCWRACLATITGIDARTMPNFMHLGTANGDESHALARDWLRPRGLTIFSHWVGNWPLDRVLREISAHNPGVAMILSGQAAKVDDTHSVVALDGAIVHDPSGAGLAGPQLCMCGAPGCDFLHWSIEVVLPLRSLSKDGEGLDAHRG